jgi:hypothetical protein
MRVFGPKRDEVTGEWRKLHNKELNDSYSLLRVKEQRNILHEISKRKANWIGHILRRNCLLN